MGTLIFLKKISMILVWCIFCFPIKLGRFWRDKWDPDIECLSDGIQLKRPPQNDGLQLWNIDQMHVHIPQDQQLSPENGLMPNLVEFVW